MKQLRTLRLRLKVHMSTSVIQSKKLRRTEQKNKEKVQNNEKLKKKNNMK